MTLGRVRGSATSSSEPMYGEPSAQRSSRATMEKLRMRAKTIWSAQVQHALRNPTRTDAVRGERSVRRSSLASSKKSRIRAKTIGSAQVQHALRNPTRTHAAPLDPRVQRSHLARIQKGLRIGARQNKD